jgi:hypothetical protein
MSEYYVTIYQTLSQKLAIDFGSCSKVFPIPKINTIGKMVFWADSILKVKELVLIGIDQ